MIVHMPKKSRKKEQNEHFVENFFGMGSLPRVVDPVL